ncbi:LLM class flavin-dependent oxidoreductase [Halobacteriales archaeon QS_1_68_17]|nr:MAG: LLM class flavin-dependent oxidoreductase [Halobacteriales archaeon QS_1_68_17]
MKFGFFPKEGGPDFDGVLDEVRAGEDVGFDQCWITEHHESEENYWAAPFTRLGAMAGVTDEIDFVTAIVVSPLHNAVELAENALVFDQISEGRFIFGTAVGYVAEEFEAYGIDMDERAGRYIEGMKLLDNYLSSDEPIDFDGEFWSLEDWQPIPPSYQDPRPTFWVGGWGDMALKRSVHLGEAWVPGGTADLDGLVERMEKLEDFADEAGQDYADIDQPLMREAIIAEDHDEAMRMGRKYLHRAYTEEYGTEEWSHPFITQEQAADFEKLADERFLVGTPDEIIEQIQQFDDRFPIDHLGCRFHFPGMSHEMVQEQIELFGNEVIPSFD